MLVPNRGLPATLARSDTRAHVVCIELRRSTHHWLLSPGGEFSPSRNRESPRRGGVREHTAAVVLEDQNRTREVGLVIGCDLSLALLRGTPGQMWASSVGSDIHVMLVKRFCATVGQHRLPIQVRSTENSTFHRF